MRSRWIRGLVAGAAVLALMAAACGGGDDGDAGNGGTTEPAEQPADGGGATVTATDFRFTPAEVSVASGDAITFRNSAPGTPHTFTVEGTDIDVTAEGGTSQDVDLDVDAGTYQFACRFHAQMEGTLMVA